MITESLIDKICSRLAANRPVREMLPGGGRIHIDRQLPFLVIYRRPIDKPDPGTEQLLLGEASYLLDLGQDIESHGLRELVAGIAEISKNSFGDFIVLELWASPVSSKEQDVTESLTLPFLKIWAPRHGAPAKMLEELESGLLEITVDGCPAKVALEYKDQISAPGFSPIAGQLASDLSPVRVLGLEVKPVYRDRQTLELFPFELKALRQQLAHALKKGFYSFAHEYSDHRPAHYHELGRHAMTDVVWETDEKLSKINRQFDLLLHVTPVNVTDAWLEFSARNYELEPQFNYRARPVDPGLLKRALYQIPLEEIEDPTLAHIFYSKREELDRQISLVSDRNTSRFLPGSMQIYGNVEDSLLSLSLNILRQVPAEGSPARVSSKLNADQFAELARAELDYYSGFYPELAAKVYVRSDVSGIMVSHGDVLIGSDAEFSEQRIEAVLAHEVGTHVVTYYNGLSQPFRQLYMGMEGYESLQEGLAVLTEYLVGQLDANRLRTLAARVIAVHSAMNGADFVETFKVLHETYQFHPYTSFIITMRVYRGGGYTKDAIYLQGLTQLLEYLANDGDFEILLLGKLSYQYLDLIEELMWRKILKPGPLHPRYLQDKQALHRLDGLRDGLNIIDLVKE